ncbi:MAG TPA: hypothetical protein VG407_12650 [Caulobacteraceae bacterium]|jgi:transposase-like protein|nr:hypothetical protein [Caulobacteraceae bacterium]
MPRGATGKPVAKPGGIAPPPVLRAVSYDDAFREAVVAFMGRGFSLTAFGGEIGVSRATLEAWRKRHRAFDKAVKVGEAARARALEAQLLDAESGAKVSAHVFALKWAAEETGREGGDDARVPIKLELAIRFV